MIKTCMAYTATDTINVIIQEGDTLEECCLIKIRQSLSPNDTGSEILFPACDLPDLIRALTSASLDAFFRDSYLVGHADGIEAIKPLALESMDKYYKTEEGKKALQKELEKRNKKKKDNIHKLR